MKSVREQQLFIMSFGSIQKEVLDFLQIELSRRFGLM